MQRNMNKIFIIEDDLAVSSALKALFESIELLVETYTNSLDFLAKLTPNTLGCIITDVRLPGISGLELLQTLNEKSYSLPVIFITGYGDISMAVTAMKAGAFDFITKPFNNQLLISQAQKALTLLPSIEKKLTFNKHFSKLTDREKNILLEITQGKLSKEIASSLNVSLSTIDMYRSRLLKKMCARNTSELIKNYLFALKDINL